MGKLQLCPVDWSIPALTFPTMDEEAVAYSWREGVRRRGDGPSLSDENEEEFFSMFLDAEKLNAQLREASETESSCASAGAGAGPRPRHHHSHSMDASSSFDAEQLLGAPSVEGMSTVEAKKAMSNAKLAELALVDPKKAKRIWANRQSAARSKERKMRYISELERKVQTLHAEATTLSTQLALLHRDTAGLSTENSELKMRLQNVEQQIHLQDALNDALKSELQRLKMATSHMGNTVGGMMNLIGPPPPHSFGGNQPMFHIQGQAAMQPLHQMQQIHPQHQQPLLHPLQLQAQQLLLQQQASAAPPPNPKMKRAISAPNQWIGGWCGCLLKENVTNSCRFFGFENFWGLQVRMSVEGKCYQLMQILRIVFFVLIWGLFIVDSWSLLVTGKF
ncbi:unnamed protein product [Triticum turgidum subsp. durum]|uniref:BZIP domain-containing protein n=1 Tax=Triticum turgidum subsp. durum TaxID=4567 RepID=A0A9R1BMY2_TRITD|nr:unnamed protein product [Triticum turgidum subsp. durum]